MDIELDNNKVNETDKTSQPSLLNANKQIKTDDDETGGQINDDLNNKIELNTTNNAFAEIMKESGNHLNLFSHDDNNMMSPNIEKSSFENNEDMGPETSVDTTDDVDHDTNILECSTLSHSKETTPSSDNPFDYKLSPQDSESEDIHNNKAEKISSFNESFSPFLQKPNEESTEEMNVPPSEDFFNMHSIPSREAFDLLSDINETFMNEPEMVLEPMSNMITEVLKNEDQINESDDKLEKDVINEPNTPDLIQVETNDPQKEQTEEVHSQSVHETISSSSTPKIDDTEVLAENLFSIAESPTDKIFDTLHESEVHEIDSSEQDAHKSNGDIIKSDIFSGLVKENETSEDHEYYGEENIGNKSPENLNKTQEDIILMGFSVEKTSTYGDSELERESELETEETIKKEIFSSLDCEQKADQDKKTEVEHTESDLKGDVGSLKTNELYATTPHESCDESADEWDYMKSKGENTKEDDSKKIGSEETANNQSQESEELIKQEPEEKASDTTIKHSERFEEKYSESLDKEVEDMTSQLNPEAKEFVPTTSPVPGELSASPPPLSVAVSLNGDVVVAQSTRKGSVSMDVIPVLSDNEIANQSSELDTSSAPEEMPPKSLLLNCLNTDEVVAQSPRKGAAISMENIQVPTETEFDSEIANRPSEIGVSTSDPYQELNLKEAMHGSEKEEQSSPDEQYGNSIFESADMRTSMYVENSLGKIEDEMNKIQQLPNDNDETQDLSFEEPSRNEINVTDKNDSILSAATLNDHSNDSIELNGIKQQDLALNCLSPSKQNDLSPIKKEETITKTNLDNKLSKVSDSKKIDPKTKSVSGPKKVVSSISATLSDNAKPRTALTASKTKVGVSTSQSTRPRTAPVSSSKPLSTEKKPSSNAISARTKIETKPTSTIGAKKVPLTKPKVDESKTGTRPLPSKVGLSTKPTSRTASTTSTATTKRAPISASSLTTKTLGPRPTLSPNTKTAPITATSKPAISPRSTVTSTLRKTEAVKSPTTGPKLTSVRTTTTTTTTTATRPTGSALHKAPTSSTAPIARKLPATASKLLTKKPVTKATSTVKQSATTKVTTSSVKTETCEIKMNGSSNGENKN